jgi:hypothetical protein
MDMNAVDKTGGSSADIIAVPAPMANKYVTE